MRSEHGNSLHFISSAVHFLYNNFSKKSIFSTTTSQKSRCSLHKHPPKKPFFREFFQKNRSPKARVAPPPGVGPAVPTRRPTPTELYQSLSHSAHSWHHVNPSRSWAHLILFIVRNGLPSSCTLYYMPHGYHQPGFGIAGSARVGGSARGPDPGGGCRPWLLGSDFFEIFFPKK